MEDILKQLALEKVKSNPRFYAMDSKEVYDLFMTTYSEFLSYDKEDRPNITCESIEEFYKSRS